MNYTLTFSGRVTFMIPLASAIVLYRRGKKLGTGYGKPPATMYTMPGGFAMPQGAVPMAGPGPMPPPGYTHAAPAMTQPGGQQYGMVYYYPIPQPQPMQSNYAPPPQVNTPWVTQTTYPGGYPPPPQFSPSPTSYQEPYTGPQDSHTERSPYMTTVTPKQS